MTNWGNLHELSLKDGYKNEWFLCRRSIRFIKLKSNVSGLCIHVWVNEVEGGTERVLRVDSLKKKNN